MPRAPTVSTRGRHFIDSEDGRVLWLRGANVGASSKVPTRQKPHLSLDRHREVTYVNRPFPLDEADDHLARLASWGMNFLRITVTWEAIEHAGYGEYDTDYLTYLRSLLSLLPKHGLQCFVAMHQDIWSRLSGGSGAPGWTLEAVGFDLSGDGKLLEETGAAYLGGVREGEEMKADRGRWPTGYQKLVCATMNTCFWAGDFLASKIRVTRPVRDPRRSGETEVVGIQTYLQDAFFASFKQLVDAVGDLEGVIGYELLNEPHPGYLTVPSLHGWNYNVDLHLSHTPSALQSFALGAGHPTRIPNYTRSWPFPTRHTSDVLVNPDGRCVWRKDGPTRGRCIWEMMGVWGWDEGKKEPVVLREHYFSKLDNGREIDFYKDAYFPFISRWSNLISSLPNANIINGKPPYLFVEAVPNEFCPKVWPEHYRPKEMIYAPHWYDLNALFTKSFGFMTVNVQGLSRGKFLPLCLYFGQSGALKNYTHQLSNILSHAYANLGEQPVVIGEIGIPMDLDGSLGKPGEGFARQERMMGAVVGALDKVGCGFTLWNYNPGNNDIEGDKWNGENFSWFSQTRAVEERFADGLKSGDLEGGWWDAGARLLNVLVRPYPIALAGLPVSSTFNPTNSAYTLKFTLPPTNIIPSVHPEPEEDTSFSSSNDPARAQDEATPATPAPLTSTETTIFFPSRVYGVRHSAEDVIMKCSEGRLEWNREEQRLVHYGKERWTKVEREVEITVRIRGQAEEIVGFAGYTLSTWLGALLCLLVGMFVSAMKR